MPRVTNVSRAHDAVRASDVRDFADAAAVSVVDFALTLRSRIATMVSSAVRMFASFIPM
ncbi:MAG: hypothetical protein ACO3F9_07320 [Burkholderiales bacterium]